MSRALGITALGAAIVLCGAAATGPETRTVEVTATVHGLGRTPEEAFYVKCDAETNPRYLIDAGQVNVQVGICPVKPAEFVIFSIGQWDGGALIEE